MYIKYVPYNNNPKYYKDSVNCSIFYIPINKNKNIHLRIYK